MSKELEQLRLNMITTMMELDYESLLKIKNIMENQEQIVLNNTINEETVDFIDYDKLSKKEIKDSNKPNIVFL